jgi:hypothetical protein
VTTTSKFVIRPVAEPQVIEDVYTDDQHRRLMKLIREEGPWKMILALHFKSPEEVVATTSGSVPEGVKLTWDPFLSPNFRGYLAKAGVSLYPEIDDLFYNPKHLAQIRSYWGAKYAVPDNMNFVMQGPSINSDPGHLDATEFRGMTQATTPILPRQDRRRLHLLARRSGSGAQACAAADVESRRRGPERDDVPSG